MKANTCTKFEPSVTLLKDEVNNLKYLVLKNLVNTYQFGAPITFDLGVG